MGKRSKEVANPPRCSPPLGMQSFWSTPGIKIVHHSLEPKSDFRESPGPRLGRLRPHGPRGTGGRGHWGDGAARDVRDARPAARRVVPRARVRNTFSGPAVQHWVIVYDLPFFIKKVSSFCIHIVCIHCVQLSMLHGH